MQAQLHYHFEAKLWKHKGKAAWYFVTLPIELSAEIRQLMQWKEEGWGRMKVKAVLNELQWETSIWFDKKQNSYLLPIKANIRKKEQLIEGDQIRVELYI